jgi:hypothetical protein
MLTSRIATCLVALSFGPVPALAQSSGSQMLSQMVPGNVASAAADAAKALGSAAQDKLLVRDLLGAPVSGPGGGTVGTVADLVVIPGGRVVAAIIAAKDKKIGRIPVPFSAAKVSHTTGKLGLSLPVSLSDLKGMKEVQSLTQAIPGNP